jgi:hypothetical protein
MAKWSALSSPISIFLNVCDIVVGTERRRSVQMLHYRRYIFPVQWAGARVSGNPPIHELTLVPSTPYAWPKMKTS